MTVRDRTLAVYDLKLLFLLFPLYYLEEVGFVKGYKMTLNKRDEPLTIADVLLIQAAKEKRSYGQGDNC